MNKHEVNVDHTVIHYDGMIGEVVNAVKCAFEDEGFDPSAPIVTEAAINAFLMEAYEQEVSKYNSLSVGQINAYKDVVRQWMRIRGLKVTCEE